MSLQVAAACVLPKDVGGVALGREGADAALAASEAPPKACSYAGGPHAQPGHAENVVLLDLDAKFDELRLFQVLSVRLSQALQQRCAQRTAQLHAFFSD